MWVRFDALTANQVLFESGDDKSGISLTLGDADSNGKANDLRFRALSSTGEALTATVAIDQFADPTRDFVQVVGVVNDAASSRSLELYVNGRRFGFAQASATAQGFDWDGYDNAGLGRIGGAKLGAAGGAGLQPFSGSMAGEIAAFRFANGADQADAVLARYNATLPGVDEGIVQLVGAAESAEIRPSSVASGLFETGSSFVAMLERRDVLDANLPVDLIPALNPQCCTNPAATPVGGVLPSGQSIASYLVHFDPLAAPSTLQTAIGSIRFDQPILGILFQSSSLAATDRLLGTIGQYALGDRGLSFLSGDALSVSPDQRTLSLTLKALADEVVQLRVVTAATSDYYADADFNGDGAVDLDDLNDPGVGWLDRFGVDLDGNDLLAWQRHFGQPATPALATPGDFNGDGQVDQDDLEEPVVGWLARFGNGLDGGDLMDWQSGFSPAASLAISATNVPEAETLVMGLLAAACSAPRGRRRPLSRS
jgi:hypothetical protein